MTNKIRIKKDDKVVVITGKDQSKTGKVLKVFPSTGRLVVEGVNLRKRRERPRSAGKPGQVVESPAPFPVAKVMLWCADCGRGRRIGHKMEGKKKLRICRQCGHEFK